MSLKTRDPGRASGLARRLAARWDAEVMYSSSVSHLTLQQRTQIFRDALADALALATVHTMDGTVLDKAQKNGGKRYIPRLAATLPTASRQTETRRRRIISEV